jgi:baculoviral IAP repeat-containing protein 6
MAEAMDTSSPLDPGSLSHKCLLDEFRAWKEEDKEDNAANRRNADKMIALARAEQDADEGGKTSLVFDICLGGQQSFTLHCPLNYPRYSVDEENFFVEAESAPGLQLWCNALNEYLLDSGGRLGLSAILNKGLSLYSSADQVSSVEARCSSPK